MSEKEYIEREVLIKQFETLKEKDCVSCWNQPIEE